MPGIRPDHFWDTWYGRAPNTGTHGDGSDFMAGGSSLRPRDDGGRKPQSPGPRGFHPRGEQAARRQQASSGKPGTLEGPGAGEEWIAANMLGQLADPQAMGQWWAQNQAAMGQPGMAEQWAQQNLAAASGPGAAAQQWAQMQGQVAQPGAAQAFWDQVAGGANDPTRSAAASDAFQAGPAGLDPYYERAQTRALARMNDQLAARGMHGSGKGLQALGDTSAGLAAEQANREAQHRLQSAQVGGQLAQAADQARMNQLGRFGQLAGQAQQMEQARMGLGLQGAQMAGAEDLARLGMGANIAGMGQNAAQSRMMQGAQMAGMAGREDLSRMGLGMQAGSQAQQLQQARIQQMLDNMFRNTQMAQGIAGPWAQQQLSSDQGLMEQSMEALLAEARARSAQAQQNTANQQNQQGIFGNQMGMLASMFGLG